MTTAKSFLVSIVLATGLTTACGQNATTAEDKAEAATVTAGASATAAAPHEPTETAAAEPNASIEAVAAAAPARAATVKTLPLRRGFYVASDTPCGQASNATLLLVTREGVNGAREVCTFRKIEKTGAASYRVTSACSGETITATYEIPDETSFKVTYEGGGASSARYCAQSSLPDPWRDNDISDVTG